MQLFDTLTREVRPLEAEDGQRLRLYVCGPTVYGPAHIGNFRTFALCDVLRRTAEVAGLRPFYVRNITDVDDKTIKGSQESGKPLREFTQQWTEKFHADCARLNLVAPDVEPAATDHIAEQVALVEKLLASGHAYVGGDGSVYYKVSCFHDYGKLSHFDPTELRTQEQTSSGAANAADEYARDQVSDFALWKARKPEDGDNVWPGPRDPATGEAIPGRPGWHLECSAMAMKYLGDTFDLHAGGEDLCFPHHENEIAQSEAATGKPFVRHWMHCVHLLVEGKKMSKSLGNFFTLEDLLSKGHTPQAVRYTLIGGYYRQQLNFTLSGLSGSESALKKLDRAVAGLLEKQGMSRGDWASLELLPADEVRNTRFGPALDALFDDLNTSEALGGLHSGLRQSIAGDPLADIRALKTVFYALGLDLLPEQAPQPKDEAPAEIQELAQRRWDAKKARDWATADAIRNELTAQGWTILDTKDGWKLEKK